MARQNDSLSSTFAKETQGLTKLYSELAKLGIRDDEIQLPGIVVVGNQSAGKSSLVEAISKIALPRDVGTCTRCPVQIAMFSNDETMDWSYSFSIQLQYDRKSGGKLISGASTIDFGSVLQNRQAVTPRIKRAQMFLLLPDLTVEDCLNKSLEELEREFVLKGTKTSFSKNTIHVEVKGPGLQNLIFTDLPGLISTTGKRSSECFDNSVGLIRSLVEEQMAKTSNLILLTMPITDDINNQAAFDLAAAADPSGTRRIGVLTKPDILQTEEEVRRTWLPIFLNKDERYSLSQGYFVTKQPGFAQERTEDYDHEELQWLRETEPWKSVPLQFQNRTGIGHLITFLSKLLSGLHRASLPTLIDQIEAQHLEVVYRLNSLPPPPARDPLFELQLVCRKLSTNFRAFTSCAAEYESFVQDVNVLYEHFGRAIIACKPVFSLKTDQECEFADGGPSDTSLEISVEEEAGELLPTKPEPRGKKGGKGSNANVMGEWQVINFNLVQMREHVRKYRGIELPLCTPYAATLTLIRRTSQTWSHEAVKCFESVRTTTTSLFLRLCEELTENYVGNEFRERLMTTFDLQSNKLSTKTLATLKSLTNVDQIPFTQNLHYLKECRDKALRTMKDMRAPFRNFPTLPEATPGFHSVRKVYHPPSDKVQDALTALSNIGYNVKKEDLPALLGPDEYEEEMIVMAGVLAYFKVSYKAVITQDYIRELGNIMEESLLEEFSLKEENTVESLKDLVAEDEWMKTARDSLQASKDRLQEAKELVRKFKKM
ncbi:hypothetical protein BT69DRAFT_1329459 [Atractiella rhizophila]|nr:hypothetical protein BT69DRAFT_1329459 [Atractiella rhizophila]